MSKIEFLYESKLRNCDKVFRKRMNPGVLKSQARSDGSI